MKKLLVALSLFLCNVCTVYSTDSLARLDTCLTMISQGIEWQSIESFWTDNVASFVSNSYKAKFNTLKKNYKEICIPAWKRGPYKFGIASLALVNSFVGENGLYKKFDDIPYLDYITTTMQCISDCKSVHRSQELLKMNLLFDIIKAEVKPVLLDLYYIVAQLSDEKLIEMACSDILFFEEFVQDSLRDYSKPFVLSDIENILLNIVPSITIPVYDSGKYLGMPDFSKVTAAFELKAFDSLVKSSQADSLGPKQKSFLQELVKELYELQERLNNAKDFIEKNKNKIKFFVKKDFTKDSVEKTLMTPPVLTNIYGGTCYFDTAVQLLLNIKPLMKFLLGNNKETYRKGIGDAAPSLAPWIDFFEVVFSYPTTKNIPILPIREAYEKLVKSLDIQYSGFPITVLKKFADAWGLFAGSWGFSLMETAIEGDFTKKYFYWGPEHNNLINLKEAVLVVNTELAEGALYPEWKKVPEKITYDNFNWELISFAVVRAPIESKDEDEKHVFPVIKSQYMKGEPWYFCDAEYSRNKLLKNQSDFWVEELKDKFYGATPFFAEIACYKLVK